MHIFRKTLFLLSLFVAGFTSQAKAQISVMSFNIRLDASVDNENRWDNRKGEVAKMLHLLSARPLGHAGSMPQPDGRPQGCSQWHI